MHCGMRFAAFLLLNLFVSVKSFVVLEGQGCKDHEKIVNGICYAQFAADSFIGAKRTCQLVESTLSMQTPRSLNLTRILAAPRVVRREKRSVGFQDNPESFYDSQAKVYRLVSSPKSVYDVAQCFSASYGQLVMNVDADEVKNDIDLVHCHALCLQSTDCHSVIYWPAEASCWIYQKFGVGNQKWRLQSDACLDNVRYVVAKDARQNDVCKSNLVDICGNEDTDCDGSPMSVWGFDKSSSSCTSRQSSCKIGAFGSQLDCLANCGHLDPDNYKLISIYVRKRLRFHNIELINQGIDYAFGIGCNPQVLNHYYDEDRELTSMRIRISRSCEEPTDMYEIMFPTGVITYVLVLKSITSDNTFIYESDQQVFPFALPRHREAFFDGLPIDLGQNVDQLNLIQFTGNQLEIEFNTEINRNDFSIRTIIVTPRRGFALAATDKSVFERIPHPYGTIPQRAEYQLSVDVTGYQATTSSGVRRQFVHNLTVAFRTQIFEGEPFVYKLTKVQVQPQITTEMHKVGKEILIINVKLQDKTFVDQFNDKEYIDVFWPHRIRIVENRQYRRDLVAVSDKTNVFNVVVGEFVKVECDGGASAPVVWYKVDGENQRTSLVFSNKQRLNMLVIDLASLSDSGNYVCAARNKSGLLKNVTIQVNDFDTMKLEFRSLRRGLSYRIIDANKDIILEFVRKTISLSATVSYTDEYSIIVSSETSLRDRLTILSQVVTVNFARVYLSVKPNEVLPHGYIPLSCKYLGKIYQNQAVWYLGDIQYLCNFGIITQTGCVFNKFLTDERVVFTPDSGPEIEWREGVLYTFTCNVDSNGELVSVIEHSSPVVVVEIDEIPTSPCSTQLSKREGQSDVVNKGPFSFDAKEKKCIENNPLKNVTYFTSYKMCQMICEAQDAHLLEISFLGKYPADTERMKSMMFKGLGDSTRKVVELQVYEINHKSSSLYGTITIIRFAVRLTGRVTLETLLNKLQVGVTYKFKRTEGDFPLRLVNFTLLGEYRIDLEFDVPMHLNRAASSAYDRDDFHRAIGNLFQTDTNFNFNFLANYSKNFGDYDEYKKSSFHVWARSMLRITSDDLAAFAGLRKKLPIILDDYVDEKLEDWSPIVLDKGKRLCRYKTAVYDVYSSWVDDWMTWNCTKDAQVVVTGCGYDTDYRMLKNETREFGNIRKSCRHDTKLGKIKYTETIRQSKYPPQPTDSADGYNYYKLVFEGNLNEVDHDFYNALFAKSSITALRNVAVVAITKTGLNRLTTIVVRAPRNNFETILFHIDSIFKNIPVTMEIDTFILKSLESTSGSFLSEYTFRHPLHFSDFCDSDQKEIILDLVVAQITEHTWSNFTGTNFHDFITFHEYDFSDARRIIVLWKEKPVLGTFNITVPMTPFILERMTPLNGKVEQQDFYKCQGATISATPEASIYPGIFKEQDPDLERQYFCDIDGFLKPYAGKMSANGEVLKTESHWRLSIVTHSCGVDDDDVLDCSTTPTEPADDAEELDNVASCGNTTTPPTRSPTTTLLATTTSTVTPSTIVSVIPPVVAKSKQSTAIPPTTTRITTLSTATTLALATTTLLPTTVKPAVRCFDASNGGNMYDAKSGEMCTAIVIDSVIHHFCKHCTRKKMVCTDRHGSMSCECSVKSSKDVCGERLNAPKDDIIKSTWQITIRVPYPTAVTIRKEVWRNMIEMYMKSMSPPIPFSVKIMTTSHMYDDHFRITFGLMHYEGELNFKEVRTLQLPKNPTQYPYTYEVTSPTSWKITTVYYPVLDLVLNEEEWKRIISEKYGVNVISIKYETPNDLKVLIVEFEDVPIVHSPQDIIYVTETLTPSKVFVQVVDSGRKVELNDQFVYIQFVVDVLIPITEYVVTDKIYEVLTSDLFGKDRCCGPEIEIFYIQPIYGTQTTMITGKVRANEIKDVQFRRIMILPEGVAQFDVVNVLVINDNSTGDGLTIRIDMHPTPAPSGKGRNLLLIDYIANRLREQWPDMVINEDDINVKFVGNSNMVYVYLPKTFKPYEKDVINTFVDKPFSPSLPFQVTDPKIISQPSNPGSSRKSYYTVRVVGIISDKWLSKNFNVNYFIDQLFGPSFEYRPIRIYRLTYDTAAMETVSTAVGLKIIIHFNQPIEVVQPDRAFELLGIKPVEFKTSATTNSMTFTIPLDTTLPSPDTLTRGVLPGHEGSEVVVKITLTYVPERPRDPLDDWWKKAFVYQLDFQYIFPTQRPNDPYLDKDVIEPVINHLRTAWDVDVKFVRAHINWDAQTTRIIVVTSDKVGDKIELTGNIPIAGITIPIVSWTLDDNQDTVTIHFVHTVKTLMDQPNFSESIVEFLKTIFDGLEINEPLKIEMGEVPQHERCLHETLDFGMAGRRTWGYSYNPTMGRCARHHAIPLAPRSHQNAFTSYAICHATCHIGLISDVKTIVVTVPGLSQRPRVGEPISENSGITLTGPSQFRYTVVSGPTRNPTGYRRPRRATYYEFKVDIENPNHVTTIFNLKVIAVNRVRDGPFHLGENTVLVEVQPYKTMPQLHHGTSTVVYGPAELWSVRVMKPTTSEPIYDQFEPYNLDLSSNVRITDRNIYEIVAEIFRLSGLDNTYWRFPSGVVDIGHSKGVYSVNVFVKWVTEDIYRETSIVHNPQRFDTRPMIPFYVTVVSTIIGRRDMPPVTEWGVGLPIPNNAGPKELIISILLPSNSQSHVRIEDALAEKGHKVVVSSVQIIPNTGTTRVVFYYETKPSKQIGPGGLTIEHDIEVIDINRISPFVLAFRISDVIQLTDSNRNAIARGLVAAFGFEFIETITPDIDAKTLIIQVMDTVPDMDIQNFPFKMSIVITVPRSPIRVYRQPQRTGTIQLTLDGMYFSYVDPVEDKTAIFEFIWKICRIAVTDVNVIHTPYGKTMITFKVPDDGEFSIFGTTSLQQYLQQFKSPPTHSIYYEVIGSVREDRNEEDDAYVGEIVELNQYFSWRNAKQLCLAFTHKLAETVTVREEKGCDLITDHTAGNGYGNRLRIYILDTTPAPLFTPRVGVHITIDINLNQWGRHVQDALSSENSFSSQFTIDTQVRDPHVIEEALQVMFPAIFSRFSIELYHFDGKTMITIRTLMDLSRRPILRKGTHLLLLGGIIPVTLTSIEEQTDARTAVITFKERIFYADYTQLHRDDYLSSLQTTLALKFRSVISSVQYHSDYSIKVTFYFEYDLSHLTLPLFIYPKVFICSITEGLVTAAPVTTTVAPPSAMGFVNWIVVVDATATDRWELMMTFLRQLAVDKRGKYANWVTPALVVFSNGKTTVLYNAVNNRADGSVMSVSFEDAVEQVDQLKDSNDVGDAQIEKQLIEIFGGNLAFGKSFGAPISHKVMFMSGKVRTLSDGQSELNRLLQSADFMPIQFVAEGSESLRVFSGVAVSFNVFFVTTSTYQDQYYAILMRLIASTQNSWMSVYDAHNNCTFQQINGGNCIAIDEQINEKTCTVPWQRCVVGTDHGFYQTDCNRKLPFVCERNPSNLVSRERSDGCAKPLPFTGDAIPKFEEEPLEEIPGDSLLSEVVQLDGGGVGIRDPKNP